MKKTLDKVDLIIANCPNYVKTSPILRGNKFEGKIRVIPLGIDESSYPTISNPLTTLQRLHFDKSQPFFLFVGVLRYYKGLHTLLQAAKSTKQMILITGSGPEETRLKKMAKDLQLSNVIFLGSVTNEEKVALIKLCSALILPSHLRSEAYGMVLVEASMYSKPMISCEIGTGTSFVNLHNQTGIVVSPENPKQLSDAINTLSETSTANALGKAARVRYEELFSGPALGKAYSDVYQSLL
jgi:rhamnosyl/mannosyltransferase